MPRVLIADDDPRNAELIEAHLDGTGWETKLAVNGEETLKLASDWKPDVILLDVMMPKFSGFEVCKRLRTTDATKPVGVLMITALDQPNDIERAIDAGTDDFLTKPINKTELLLRIRAVLQAKAESTDVARGLAYFRRVLQGV
jgi:two-component system, OmpR family, alkaline phosphatase synthesis response regulator PhoP